MAAERVRRCLLPWALKFALATSSAVCSLICSQSPCTCPSSARLRKRVSSMWRAFTHSSASSASTATNLFIMRPW
eukprot:6120187-Pleurochrysis_carterae.AAC.1